MKQLYCPKCKRSSSWDNNPSRPFCSERCRLIDLGAWSDESYRIPEKPETEVGEGWSEGNSG